MMISYHIKRMPMYIYRGIQNFLVSSAFNSYFDSKRKKAKPNAYIANIKNMNMYFLHISSFSI